MNWGVMCLVVAISGPPAAQETGSVTADAPISWRTGNGITGSPVETLLGTLAVTIACDFDHARSWTTYSLLATDGVIHQLNPPTPLRLFSGTKVRATGIHTPDGFRVDSMTQLDHAARHASENLGEQRTIVLLVNSFENPVEPITATEAHARMFIDPTTSPGAWINRVSYGRTSLSGSVSGWHTLSLTKEQLCQPGIEGEQAIMDRVDSIVAFSAYERVVIIFPHDSACWYNGVATIGKNFYINDGGVMVSVHRLNGVEEINDGTSAHEFGHNFGARHANAWECGADIISGGCASLAYKDLFDVLGLDSAGGHFDAVHKDVIGWFDNTEILNVGDTSGSYVLAPLEIEGGLKTLKIPMSGFNLYIEFRRPIGDDDNHTYAKGAGGLGVDPYRGAMIHTDVVVSDFFGGGDSQLLDMLPNSNIVSNDFDIIDSVLEVGSTFSHENVSITPTALDDTSLTICLEFGGHVDSDCDRIPDVCDGTPGLNNPDPCATIPTITMWGVAVLALVLAVTATLVISRRLLPTVN